MTNDEKLRDALNMLHEYIDSYQSYVKNLEKQVDEDSLNDELMTADDLHWTNKKNIKELNDELEVSMTGTTKSYLSSIDHSLLVISNSLSNIDRELSDYLDERGDNDGTYQCKH